MDKNPDKLFKLFSAKTPDEQKKMAMNMLSSMDSKQSDKIKEIMNDQQKIQSILSSPEAQQILNKLKGNKNG